MVKVRLFLEVGFVNILVPPQVLRSKSKENEQERGRLSYD